MTSLINELKKIASDSTVRAVAATLAVGGFLANTLFGFGQTTLGLALQGLGAAVILGKTVANAYQGQQQEAQQNDHADNFYDHVQHDAFNQEDTVKRNVTANVQTLISSFFPVMTSCGNGNARQMRADVEKEERPTLAQQPITYFFNKVQELQEVVITSCGIDSTPKRRRRNADDDMMDMAYGTGTRDGWKAWAAKRQY